MEPVIESPGLASRPAVRGCLCRPHPDERYRSGAGLQLLDILGHLRRELLSVGALSRWIWPSQPARHPKTGVPRVRAASSSWNRPNERPRRARDRGRMGRLQRTERHRPHHQSCAATPSDRDRARERPVDQRAGPAHGLCRADR